MAIHVAHGKDPQKSNKLPPVHVRHHNFEMVDEIRIAIKERWKESELSGDEWRFSVVAEMYFKGHKLASLSFRDMETAMHCLYTRWIDVCERGGDKDRDIKDPGLEVCRLEKIYCDQPGCKEQAAHQFLLKKIYGDGFEKDAREYYSYAEGAFVKFCDKHCHRGDCGLQDANANLIPL